MSNTSYDHPAREPAWQQRSGCAGAQMRLAWCRRTLPRRTWLLFAGPVTSHLAAPDVLVEAVIGVHPEGSLGAVAKLSTYPNSKARAPICAPTSLARSVEPVSTMCVSAHALAGQRFQARHGERRAKKGDAALHHGRWEKSRVPLCASLKLPPS
jgi:hypothetical protein